MSESMLKRAGVQAITAAIILATTVIGQMAWGYFQIKATQKDVIENKKDIEKKVGTETISRILTLMEERNTLYHSMIDNVVKGQEINRKAINENKRHMEEQLSKIRDALGYRLRGETAYELN